MLVLVVVVSYCERKKELIQLTGENLILQVQMCFHTLYRVFDLDAKGSVHSNSDLCSIQPAGYSQTCSTTQIQWTQITFSRLLKMFD